MSDCESIQGHFDIMPPVPTGSQDHLGMPRNHQIDMPFEMAPYLHCNPMRCHLVALGKL